MDTTIATYLLFKSVTDLGLVTLSYAGKKIKTFHMLRISFYYHC